MAGTTKSISQALFDAQGELEPIQRDAINPHFHNRYISLDSLLPQILPVLRKNGILVSQSPSNVDGMPALTTRFTGPAGDYIESTMLLVLDKDTPQAQGSALTYARRYALLATLGLTADQDDDGEAGSKGGGRQVAVVNPRPKAAARPRRGAGASAAKPSGADDTEGY